MDYIYLIGAILAIVLFSIVLTYNRLIALKNNREQAFADIDVQLKMRYDLIPNIISTVQGYAGYERSVLTDLTELRSASMNAKKIDDKVAIENQFTSALSGIFAVAENYPDLKANQNFLQLQNTLKDVEAKIAAARKFFNNATKEFNTHLATFPNNIINIVLRFEQGKFFDLSSETIARENVTVKM